MNYEKLLENLGEDFKVNENEIGFEFTRETLKLEDLPDLDKECIEYTYKFIDDLKENGVIEDEI